MKSREGVMDLVLIIMGLMMIISIGLLVSNDENLRYAGLIIFITSICFIVIFDYILVYITKKKGV